MSGVALALVATSACGDNRPLIEQSCSGESVPNCRPYEYAVVRAASLVPPDVRIGDPTAFVRIHVELETCGARTPGLHTVFLRARAVSSIGLPDAGSSERVYSLEILRDDGTTHGDPIAGDGLIDITMANPFVGDLPASTEMLLRFVPQLDTCEGEPLEVPYRTGSRWTP